MTETGIMLVLSVGYIALAALIVLAVCFVSEEIGKLIAFFINKHKEKIKL